MNRFGYALLASALAHGTLILLVPDFRAAFDAVEIPPRLDVLLVPSREAAPAPTPQAKPEPRRPEVQPRTQRRSEPLQRPMREPERHIVTASPTADSPAPAVPEPPRSIEPAPLPEVFRPATEETPRAAAPPAEPPRENLAASYGNLLKNELDKHRRYPRIAQARGWEGTTLLVVRVLPGGRLGEVSIARSSGHEILDDTAREMVRAAALPPMPEALRRDGFEMRIPIEFRLV